MTDGITQGPNRAAAPAMISISSFRGLASIAVPEEWAGNVLFGRDGREGLIRFGEHGAFAVRVGHGRSIVTQFIRLLSAAEAHAAHWRADPCYPWGHWQTTRLFGHGRVTRLDEMPPGRQWVNVEGTIVVLDPPF